MKMPIWIGFGMGLTLAIYGCGTDQPPSQPTSAAEVPNHGPRIDVTVLPSSIPSPIPSPDPDASPEPEPSEEPSPLPPNEMVLKVTGTALFGSQCPHGYFAPPQPTPIEYVSSPIHLTQFELTESLDPIVVQADCKKYTLDIRGISRSAIATTWEFPPSGNVDFSLDGGVIHVKDDGSGNLNCTTHAVVELKGKIDCTDVDLPVLHLQIFWNLGKSMTTATPPQGPGRTPNPSPTPRPAPSPSWAPTPDTGWPTSWPIPRPSLDPTWPTFPNPNRSAVPTPTPTPSSTPILTPAPLPPVPRRRFVNESVDSAAGSGTCKLPEEAYLQTPGPIEIKQCAY